jgi:Rhodopirellula transposase DDE domain
MNQQQQIQHRFQTLQTLLNERQIRLWAATEANAQGFGGISLVSEATGLSRTTISRGLDEIQELSQTPSLLPARLQRIRKPGGGRKTLSETDPDLLDALDKLIEPTLRGDPQSPLRWTCKSTAQLARELTRQGHPISDRSVSALLLAQDYSLQGNRKTQEGGSHPDRNAQFEAIADLVTQFQEAGQPAVSVDAKKKELVGNYKNAGQEWHPKADAPQVKVYDFVDAALGKVTPYGVYDLDANTAWVTVGTDHDTAEFAVQSLRNWWDAMGQPLYPDAQRLLITADGGGSNGSRNRLWKVALQDLADETGLELWVCHFPPGTSKWNKIEHRLFCHITLNWRGRPLIDHETIVKLIGTTTTQKGLKVHAQLDTQTYPIGIEISPAEMAEVQLYESEFHGEWNYLIKPNARRK